MKWVTRHHIRVNRTATAWLVRRFIDPEATLLFCGADFAGEVGLTPESAGLRAISQGFPLIARSDEEILEKASFLYDALYAALRERHAPDSKRSAPAGTRER